MKKMEPVGWIEGPWGAFKANPAYKVTASVTEGNLKTPCYLETDIEKKPDWNKSINIKKKDGNYEVFAYNWVKIGNFLAGVDGYYNWWPLIKRNGYIPAFMLRALADCLDELNKEWDEQIQNDPTINPCKS